MINEKESWREHWKEQQKCIIKELDNLKIKFNENNIDVKN